jgi:hypothetical protein
MAAHGSSVVLATIKPRILVFAAWASASPNSSLRRYRISLIIGRSFPREVVAKRLKPLIIVFHTEMEMNVDWLFLLCLPYSHYLFPYEIEGYEFGFISKVKFAGAPLIDLSKVTVSE